MEVVLSALVDTGRLLHSMTYVPERISRGISIIRYMKVTGIRSRMPYIMARDSGRAVLPSRTWLVWKEGCSRAFYDKRSVLNRKC